MNSSWIELNGEALRHNVRFFSQLVGAHKLCPVLKSNAYGHGLQEIYELLAPLDPQNLGVNSLSEALFLRQLGFTGCLIVFAALPRESLPQAHKASIEYFVTDQESLQHWLASPSKPRIHLKFNTGLNRQGLALDQAPHIAEQCKHFRSQLVGICTHFANVEDVSNHTFTERQLALFGEVRRIFREAGLRVKAHCASSASGLLLPESHLDLLRLGISLYGLWPSPLTKLSYCASNKNGAEALRPVLSWRCPLSLIQTLAAGEFVGYGCTFRASQPMKIALLRVGYFEGYPRLGASQGGSYVLVKGQRCPLLGRISMNMMMVDVSSVAEAKVGSIATLIGSDGNEQLSAEDLGAWAQSINYEIVARLNPDIPRQRSCS